MCVHMAMTPEELHLDIVTPGCNPEIVSIINTSKYAHYDHRMDFVHAEKKLERNTVLF